MIKLLFAATLIFAFYLLVTCLVEGAVAGLVFRKFRFVKYIIACNVITNPLLNLWLYLIAFVREFGLLELFETDWHVLFLCGEVLVVFVEAWIYHYILQRKMALCFLVSFLANLCSAAVGLVFMWFEEQWVSSLVEFVLA